MIHSVTQNGCVSTKLFCVAKNMTQKKLLNYLKSGIFPSYIIGHFLMLAAKNGSVCYGNNNIRKIEKLSDLDILPIIFFDSALNGDYYYSGRTTLKKKQSENCLIL